MYDSYLYFQATAALYTLTVITVLCLFAGIICSVILWTKGKAKMLHHPLNISAVLKAFIFDCILQVQILKISFVRWAMHFCIFMGFMGLFAQTSLMAIMSHFLPPDTFLARTFFATQNKLGGAGSRILDVWGDIFGLMLVLGLTIAIIRRYIVRTKQLETILKDTMSIALLTAIALTGFLCEGLRLTQPLYAEVAAYSFAGNFLAGIFTAMGFTAATFNVWVWIHALISLFFCGYIPFSKAWHVFVSPIEIVLDASERA
ncbi:MAG: respiratory nitrate reductase subunit gamma [Pseudomonadota bacterium]